MTPIPRTLPTFGRSTRMMADLYFRTLLRGRKTWVVGAVVALGLLLAALVGITVDPESRGTVYGNLLSQMTLGFVAQFLGLFYGIAAVREEVEAHTLTYLLVRPIPRAAILLGRLLGALVTVIGVLLPYALVSHLLAAPTEGPSLWLVLVDVVLGGAYYTTAFVAIATLLPRPFLFGLGYVFFWEFALPLVPSSAASLSMKFHLLNVLDLGADASGMLAFLMPVVDRTTSAVVLVTLTAVLAVVSLKVFPRREYLR